MRGLKIKETPSLTDYQISHNYIRTHEGWTAELSEACGIMVKGENEWCNPDSERKSKRKKEIQTHKL